MVACQRKIAYPNRDLARQAVREFEDAKYPVREYRCTNCEQYHVGGFRGERHR